MVTLIHIKNNNIEYSLTWLQNLYVLWQILFTIYFLITVNRCINSFFVYKRVWTQNSCVQTLLFGAANGTWTHTSKTHAPQTCLSASSSTAAFIIILSTVAIISSNNIHVKKAEASGRMKIFCPIKCKILQNTFISTITTI